MFIDNKLSKYESAPYHPYFLNMIYLLTYASVIAALLHLFLLMLDYCFSSRYSFRQRTVMKQIIKPQRFS